MRPRFTIRDLLWLTLVVALAVGWWVDHRIADTRIIDLNFERNALQLENIELQVKLGIRQPPEPRPPAPPE